MLWGPYYYTLYLNKISSNLSLQYSIVFNNSYLLTKNVAVCVTEGKVTVQSELAPVRLPITKTFLLRDDQEKFQAFDGHWMIVKYFLNYGFSFWEVSLMCLICKKWPSLRKQQTWGKCCQVSASWEPQTQSGHTSRFWDHMDSKSLLYGVELKKMLQRLPLNSTFLSIPVMLTRYTFH